MSKPDYDTTLARIAGNIASGFANRYYGKLGADDGDDQFLAERAVKIARAIVAEVKRTTEPAE